MLAIPIVAAAIYYVSYSRKARLEALRAKYESEEVATAIMAKQVWLGQTSAQLTDSLGNPLGIDRRVLREKVREVWKYDRRGANRYGLRITVEEGTVVGWDHKD